MTWHAPAWRVEIAPGKHPLDPPSAGDWETLTSATVVLDSLSITRGRQDQLNEFEPARATISLDDPTGDLDELVSGSTGDNSGPLTPIRVRCDWHDGTTQHTDIDIWAGYLRDGFAPSYGGYDRRRTVVAECVDWIGWAKSFPLDPSMWTTYARTLDPEVFLDGDASVTDADFKGSGNDWVLFNDIGSSGDGVGELHSGSVWFSGIASAIEASPGGGQAIEFAKSVGVKIDETWSPGTRLAVAMLFQVDDLDSRAYLAGGLAFDGDVRWDLLVNANGEVALRWFDDSESFLGELKSDQIAGFPDYADGDVHWVIAGFDASSPVFAYLNVDGQGWWSASTGTFDEGLSVVDLWAGATGSATLFESSYKIQGFLYKEGTHPTNLVDTDELQMGGLLAQGDVTLWALDDLQARLDHILDAYDLTITDEVHDPSDFEFFTYIPKSNLAELISTLATSTLGAAWMTRAGNLRLRSRPALDDASYSTHYTDVVATLTDEDSPTADPALRVSKRGRTGRRLDRVINEVHAEAGAGLGLNNYTFTHRDLTSRARYGKRIHSLASESATWDYFRDPDAIGQQLIDQYKDPPVEVGALEIRPWGNVDATQFVLRDLELERAVTYIEHDHDGTELLNADHRIQSEQWRMANGASDWTVTLHIAPIPTGA